MTDFGNGSGNDSGNQSGENRMSPSQPYLLRALNEWIVDNGMTPQLLVDTQHPGLEVPKSILGENKLVLNISANAVRDLLIDNEFVSFVARFSGVSHGVLVPIDAVLAIYTRENGQGMMFPESSVSNSSQQPPPKQDPDEQKPPSRASGKPDLKVIK